MTRGTRRIRDGVDLAEDGVVSGWLRDRRQRLWTIEAADNRFAISVAIPGHDTRFAFLTRDKSLNAVEAMVRRMLRTLKRIGA